MSILVAVACIVAALVLYSVAIWSERIQGALKRWMTRTFMAAFICDLFGTGIMWFHATGAVRTFHEWCGYAALGVMFAHLVWALVSLHAPRAARWFHRCSIYAWGLWLLAFLTGILRAGMS